MDPEDAEYEDEPETCDPEDAEWEKKPEIWEFQAAKEDGWRRGLAFPEPTVPEMWDEGQHVKDSLLQGSSVSITVVIKGAGKIGKFKKQEIQSIEQFYEKLYDIIHNHIRIEAVNYDLEYRDVLGDTILEPESGDVYSKSYLDFVAEVSRVIAFIKDNTEMHKQEDENIVNGGSTITLVINGIGEIGEIARNEVKDKQQLCEKVAEKVEVYQRIHGNKNIEHKYIFQDVYGDELPHGQDDLVDVSSVIID